jgi:hypothetical protein
MALQCLVQIQAQAIIGYGQNYNACIRFSLTGSSFIQMNKSCKFGRLNQIIEIAE